MKGEGNYKDPDAYTTITFKCISNEQCVDLIHLTQDTVQWWIVLNTVKNLLVP
jgi:hypothetical protein